MPVCFLLLLLGLAAPALADDYVRVAGVDVAHYRIALTLDDTSSAIQGETEILLDITAGGVTIIPLDFGAMTVDRVTEQGETTAFTHENGRLLIRLRRRYAPGDRVMLRVAYHGQPADGLLIKENKFGHRAIFADNWPDRARHWFPSIDHPYDKATAEFLVTAPARYDVVANGRLIETTHRQDGAKQTRWRTLSPIPTYCMVVGAAAFSVIHAGSWNGIPVAYYLYPEDRDHGIADFGRSLQMLEFYANLIGPYPYAKLALVQSSTRFGGMENASAVFFDEKAITGSGRIEGTVAHEIAHQWFGDAVTAADWHHLWLSEGFATYFGALFFERADGRDRFMQMMARSKTRYLASHKQHPAPIHDPSVTDLFRLLNAYTYSKGGWVLHMLRGLMGDAAFFAGIRDYYRTYRDETALTRHFQRVMEFHAGQPLGWFFEQWVYETGHPVYEVTWSWRENVKTLDVRIRQTQDRPVFRMPLTLAVYAGETKRRETVDVRTRDQTFSFALDAKPSQVILDPDEWVLKEVKGMDELRIGE